MSLFLATESWPFTVAVMLLLAIAVIEGLALLIGFSVSGWLDHLLPEPTHMLGSLPDSWLGWLHIGRVPLLVILVVLLTAFAIIGYALNGVAHGILGHFLPAPLAAGLAFVGALPVVRMSAATIARLIPRDESSAIPLELLVGRVAVIINGTARAGYPAQARVRTDQGQTFYVHVEPESAGGPFAPGESVLLVKQISGARFQAIANPRPDLL